MTTRAQMNTRNINYMQRYNIQLACMLFLVFLACEKADEPEAGASLPTLNTFPAGEITSNNALLSGNITGNGGDIVTSRGFVWSLQSDPSLENFNGLILSGSGMGVFNEHIGDLLPENTYYVKAFAENTAGVAYGNEIEFQTLPDYGNDGIYGEGVTDIDGNTYKTVFIGDQEWMAENLRTTHYRNGTPIDYKTKQPKHSSEKNNIGQYAWLNHDISNKNIYGALYNWHAANNPNGLCPHGWRVPGKDDWNQLFDYIVDRYDEITEDNFSNFLKSCRQINSPLGGSCDTSVHPRFESNNTHYGNDFLNFSALPGGRFYGDGGFSNHGYNGCYWTSSHSSFYPYGLFITSYLGRIVVGSDHLYEYGYSIRCIKNN